MRKRAGVGAGVDVCMSVGVLGSVCMGVTRGVAVDVAGWGWVAGFAGSIHINSTVLLFVHFSLSSSFSPFVTHMFIFSYLHIFICSCFQHASGMNNVGSLRTMFHRTAGCRKRVMDFFRE
jgi:hypothetical protein